MNPARIAIVLVAGIAAIVLALVVRNIAGGHKPPPTVVAAAAPVPMTRVLVAKVNLAVGDSLTLDNMTWQAWPAATLNAAYVSDGVAAAPAPNAAAGAISKASTTVTDMATGGGPKMQALVGSIVREPIYAGEPITAAKVVRSGDSSYMAVRLPEGMRAVAMPLSVESGAGGFIQPGDHIDILSTHPDPTKTGGNAQVTETVLANVLVLAIDQHADAPKAGATQVGSTMTLEVPEADVNLLARTRSSDGVKLTIALRSYADIGGGPGAGPGGGDTHAVRIFKGGSAEVVTAQ